MNRTFLAYWLMVCSTFPVHAAMTASENAAEMRTTCQELANASVGTNGEVLVAPTNDSMTCWGAFSALQSLATVTWKGTNHPVLPFCPPPFSSRIELVRTFADYVERHSEYGSLPFAIAAIQAFEEKYPCKL